MVGDEETGRILRNSGPPFVGYSMDMVPKIGWTFKNGAVWTQDDRIEVTVAKGKCTFYSAGQCVANFH